ncbi:hypothetical protein QBC37DRAFT_404351 [Rhypophila decipiens]|uniref:Uncharacterized protein n=1 Tax=Rhypophila decipiens TaxID=261697 RepID=A0AAN6XZC6_9PEZI|nr:hypothetical protein QBC37DRAFT_404351 [Rhypophila decipiens]
MLSKGTSTAETFDGLGDGTLKDLDNEHSRRHRELKTYLEDVLRIQQVKDVSLYSCHGKAESGTLALTWAEWKARGWDWAIEKVNMDHIEAGNIWFPRSVAEGDVRPNTRGDIPWSNIWVARLKDVARGCSPSP